MKKLVLCIGLALASTTALANGPATGKEVNFGGYGQLANQGQDNNSVVLQANDQGTTVTVTQGELGVFDGNRSAVDIRLQSPGNNNDVAITQSGNFSFNDSLVKIAGKTGGADVDIMQTGHANDSVVYMAHDEDNSTVSVTQNGVDNWSRVRSTNKSKGNETTVVQNGLQQDSEVWFDAASSNNTVDVKQGKNTSRFDNTSIVSLRAASSDNEISVNQKGNRNDSKVFLHSSTNNMVDVTQTWDDASYVAQTNSHNTSVTVTQY
ncbi:hypothetical protein [Vibrio maritimus]|uniref:hypothetical protein n=1 Tax=Vibrio maritimus TaxID=990268 RepID=UPI001F3B38D8|nr:hypothetical protein [Vibrio maritimus]